MDPKGQTLRKAWALSDHQRLIRQCGVTPLMYQSGETVITLNGRGWLVDRNGCP